MRSKVHLTTIPGASVRKRGSLGRMSAWERYVLALRKNTKGGLARVIITVKETTSLVGIIHLRRYPPER